MIRFTIIDKKTRDEVGAVTAVDQEEALRLAKPMWPSMRVEAVYPRPPMAMHNEHTRRVKRMSKR